MPEVVDTGPQAAAVDRCHGLRRLHTVRRTAFRPSGSDAATSTLEDPRPGPDSQPRAAEKAWSARWLA